MLSLFGSKALAFSPSSSTQCLARTRALHVTASDWPTRSMFSSGEVPQRRPGVTVLDPLIVCGPSGVGKGTIIDRFMKDYGDEFGFTTSHTTRKPRKGEIDSVHYHFTERDKMRQMIENGSFVEHAEVHGNFYGTSWDALYEVQEKGRRCLLDIDIQGVKRVKSLEHASKELDNGIQSSRDQQTSFQPKYIFIAPPSMEILLERLKGRGTESAESLQKRTQNAKEEVEYGMAEGNFDKILINNDLEEAFKEFEAAVHDLYQF